MGLWRGHKWRVLTQAGRVRNKNRDQDWNKNRDGILVLLTPQEGCSSPECPPAPQETHVCREEKEGGHRKLVCPS